MAVPAPAIPSGNAYTVNVAHAASEHSPLPAFAATAALLLRRHKVAVRMHVAGDNPRANALRAGLNAAGAKPSAFSPAPSPEIPGEGFWKTTVTVVEAAAGPNFWAGERADKKVEWEPLLIALTDRVSPADLPVGLAAIPDLWCVATNAENDPATLAARWIVAGAKAVCVLGPNTIAWNSTGAVFGQSEGSHAFSARPDTESSRPLGTAAAGIVAGMIRELLGENLFDKTLIRADRECLEMRPLRLGRAVLNAAAALEALPHVAHPLVKGSGFAEATENRFNELRGPESKAWAHKGR